MNTDEIKKKNDASDMIRSEEAFVTKLNAAKLLKFWLDIDNQCK